MKSKDWLAVFCFPFVMLAWAIAIYIHVAVVCIDELWGFMRGEND